MKKLLFILICSILVAGCGKVDSEKALKEFETKVSNSDNYTLTGTMEIINNEDVYNYECFLFKGRLLQSQFSKY